MSLAGLYQGAGKKQSLMCTLSCKCTPRPVFPQHKSWLDKAQFQWVHRIRM